MSRKHDFVIVGSGLGGLVSAMLLTKHGYDVCVVEKNRQFGGNLQNFSRAKRLFDTGVHYVGGLDTGQNLYQYFAYLGIMDHLKIQKLDIEGFDIIGFAGDDTQYRYAMGYSAFEENLIAFFPGEQHAIHTYCTTIQDICQKFPLYNLRAGESTFMQEAFLTWSAKSYINSLTTNQKLRDVLGGTNLLYAGDDDKTPFYVHALVVNSYIESSYRFLNGSSHLTKVITKQLRLAGATLRNNAPVTEFVFSGEKLTGVQLADGEQIEGNTIISNLSPNRTLDLVGPGRLRSSYTTRIQSLKSTPGAFSLYLAIKPGTTPYPNYNYYYALGKDVWNLTQHNEQTWPLGFAVFSPAESDYLTHTRSLSILTYMHMHEVEQWSSTYKTDSHPDDRGPAYEDFKLRKAEKLLHEVYKVYPDLKSNIESYYASTPLTYRDYIGIQEGSMYGYAKDVYNPLTTMVSHKTKIPNLFMTGQNIHMHGVLGVTIGAFVTCGAFLDIPSIIEEVQRA